MLWKVNTKKMKSTHTFPTQRKNSFFINSLLAISVMKFTQIWALDTILFFATYLLFSFDGDIPPFYDR